MTKIKDLQKGAYFTLTENDFPIERQVYVRGDYNRMTKKYECCRFDDISAVREFKGDKKVFTDFIF